MAQARSRSGCGRGHRARLLLCLISLTPMPAWAAGPAAESITLSDGRSLCFARYGSPGGKPVVYLHGASSSRLEGELYAADARAAGLEILAPDRPGCGCSSPQVRRSVPAYAADLRELAEALELEPFVVAGMSNGGMYAIAAARALPRRVSAAILINASTPLHDARAREVTPLGVRLRYGLLRYAAPVLIWMIDQRDIPPEADDLNARSARELRRQPGSQYLQQEMQLAARPWGFDHTAATQPVVLFSGDQDPGFNYAATWADELPDARLHVFPGGHSAFSEPAVIRQIVAAMAAASE